MLEPLRQSFNHQAESPATVAKGLRRLVLSVYVSQVALVLVAAILVLVLVPPRLNVRGWAVWLAGFSFVFYFLVSAVMTRVFEQKRTFVSAMQAAIFLGIASTVPAVLACLLLALEGPRAGAPALAITSAMLLVASLARVTGYALRIQSDPKPEVERFEGFGSSSDFARPDWAEQYGPGKEQQP